MESRPPETASRYWPAGSDWSAFANAFTLLRYPRGKRPRHGARIAQEPSSSDHTVESTYGGPLGTLIAGVGMCAFYLALIWINALLGMFLTPFFLTPLTWIQDALNARRKAAQA